MAVFWTTSLTSEKTWTSLRNLFKKCHVFGLGAITRECLRIVVLYPNLIAMATRFLKQEGGRLLRQLIFGQLLLQQLMLRQLELRQLVLRQLT